MTDLSRRRFLSISGGVVAGSYLAGHSAAAASIPTGGPPATIPALQEWSPQSDGFVLRRSSRILVSDTPLRNTAAILAEDLFLVARLRLPVVVARNPRPGDVVLSLDSGVAQESYEIRVGSSIVLSGTDDGVFLGTRTLVQWFRQTRSIPGGTARDWPRYRERGLLVANAPKVFSMQWWQGQIRELSYVKMNMLWLYIGYSTTPAAQMTAIAEFARRYHITVVPQVDMPGHMDRLLCGRPDLQLAGAPGALDLANDSAYPFARGLVRSVINLIDTPFWHLGADEYLSDYTPYPQLGAYAKKHYGPQAVPQDIEYGFINYINKYVRASGKTARMWNDGIVATETVPIDADVIIEHWASYAGLKTPQQLIDAGHRVHNANEDFLYYDSGGRHPDPAAIYEKFHVGLFQAGLTVADDSPNLTGAKLHLWTAPDIEPEQAESDNLAAPLRSLAQILWGSPKPVPSYQEFEPLINTLGRAPGFPPLRLTTWPVADATSFPPRRDLSVQFYDPVQPSSVAISLRTSQGTPIAGTVAYDATTNVATFTPAAPLGFAERLVATVRARPTPGVASTLAYSWGFQTALAALPDGEHSIWQDSDQPDLIASDDANTVELGVKFRADVPGEIRGIRYYKAPANLGIHICNLWADDGTRLATARCSDESAAGWQDVRFGTPVPIAANTTYIASYHAEVGHYAAQNNAFVSTGKDNPPLHALRDGVDGGNGVFSYGCTEFPTSTYAATNYWIDLIFAES